MARTRLQHLSPDANPLVRASTIELAAADAGMQSLVDPSLSLRLHSDPGATHLIVLDFDGHTTTDTPWNSNSGVATYISPAYDLDGDPSQFSSLELARIQQIWQQVAADFAPFALNVTTQEPPVESLIRRSSDDIGYGIRVVISSEGPYAAPGGVAYLNSFTWDSDTPTFVYETQPISVANTISHEVGHTLGLTHDGSTTVAYYGGHGWGEESWGPIMGSSASRNVTSWDDGSFSGSTNTGAGANQNKGADDLAVITNANGFGYRADREADNISGAVPLNWIQGSLGQFGTIETRSDRDVFGVVLTSPGVLSLSANPYWSRAFVANEARWGSSSTEQQGPVVDIDATTPWIDNGSNLDLQLELLNSSGEIIASANPVGLVASLAGITLQAGQYFIRLDGVGAGNPTASTPTGYSDYASIGNYWLSGTIQSVQAAPKLSAVASSVLEGSNGGITNAELELTLNTPASQDVIVNLSTRDGSASSKGKTADFTAISNGQLVIPKGQTSGRLTLAINADMRVEANEQFSVVFDGISGAELGIGAVDITIVNDDLITGGGGGKKSSLLAATDFSSTDDSLALMGSSTSSAATTPAATLLGALFGGNHASTQAFGQTSSGVIAFMANSWALDTSFTTGPGLWGLQ